MLSSDLEFGQVYPRLDLLNELIERKLVKGSRHPTLPLTIYNYTPMVIKLSPDEWPWTLKEARGLVLDDAGKLVARGFPKFFNAGQENFPPGVRKDNYRVYEKADGSLLIVFLYEGQMVVATRGSFVSEQAIDATAWFSKELSGFSPGPNNTTVFEWISPENRIVVDYGDYTGALYLCDLGPSGKTYFDPWYNDNKVGRTHLSCVNDFHHSLDELVKVYGDSKGAEREGFVVDYGNGAFRAKYKFEDYVRLHRLYFNTSNRAIWELLSAADGKEVLQLASDPAMPQDFRDWVLMVATNILKNVWSKDQDARAIVDRIRQTGMKYPSAQLGKYVQSEVPKDLQGLVFNLLAGKIEMYHRKLWDGERPTNSVKFTEVDGDV